MNFREVLAALANGEVSVDDAVKRLRSWSVESFDDAIIDHDREQRQGRFCARVRLPKILQPLNAKCQA